MALQTERILIDVTLPDGTEFDSATFFASITEPTWDVVDNHAVPRSTVTAPLDDDTGTGEIYLWPNDRGEKITYYTAKIRAVLAGATKPKDYVIGSFQVLDDGGPYDLSQLLSAYYEGEDTFQPNGATFYVSQKGADTNRGTNLTFPFRTVNKGLSAAREFGEPCAVIVHPGEYEVQPNSEIPTNCCLYGYDLRVTKLRLPGGSEENNMFLMRSGIKVRGFTFTNLRHEAAPDYGTVPNGLAGTDNTDYFTVNGTTSYINDEGSPKEVTYPYPPSKGFAFAFKPGEVITRSPYISDCTTIHNLTQDELKLPLDRANGNPLMPRGCGCLVADGSVLSPNSPLRSVVVANYTAVNPNGVAYLAKKNAFAQLVSVFTNWSRVGLWAHYGGQFTVANSNNTFGDYSMAATEARKAVRIPPQDGEPRAVHDDVANAITSFKSTLINDIYAQLESEFTTVANFTAEQEAFTRRDLDNLLTQLKNDFNAGQDRNSQYFVKGLFDWNGGYVFDPSLLNIFLRSYEITEQKILDRGPYDAGASDMLASLITLIKTYVETPSYEPVTSSIEATSQQLSYAGTGVNYLALPFTQRGTGTAPDPLDTIIESGGGRVYATFSTEAGDTYLGSGIKIDFDRGVIEGGSFTRGTQDITLPLIVALGG